MKVKAVLLDNIALERSLKRISHEILEKNKGAKNIVLIGVKRGGVSVAKRLADCIDKIENQKVQVGFIDITNYRDDIEKRTREPNCTFNELIFSIQDKDVVLCDDVLYTGRTVRAAIDAVMKHGRPSSIQLAILIDRGHRELPIRADFVGKNVPTSHEELVAVFFNSTDGETKVELYNKN